MVLHSFAKYEQQQQWCFGSEVDNSEKFKCRTEPKYQESKFSATQRILNETVKMKFTTKFSMGKSGRENGTKTKDNLHKHDNVKIAAREKRKKKEVNSTA